jgi:ribosome maturation factor RimP
MDINRKQSNISIMERLRNVAEPLCRAENFELVHLELAPCNREKIIRFFMDKPGGITLDDCVYLSQQLSDLIDVYIEDIGSYSLEVSSPGPKRPLKKKEDFERFRGERVKIETSQLIENKKKFTGLLETVNNDSVVMAVDGKQIDIRYREIGKAILAGR